MGKHALSVEKSILGRIRAFSPGKVFTPVDFLDLGARSAVDQVLSRSARRGALHKLSRGLYTLPRPHRIWGLISPPPEEVVEALSRRDGLRVLRAGTRSPGLFLTDGRARRIQVGKTLITLRHAAARRFALAAQPGGDLISSLRALGREKAEAAARELLPGLDADRRADLREARRFAPGWLSDLLGGLGC